MEDSAALTARAHPWFIARDWVPSYRASPSHGAEHLTPARRAGLIAGGVLAGLILLLSIYLWGVQVIGLWTPPPPIWGGVVLGAIFALVAPVGTYLTWRGGERARVPLARRIQRTEQVGVLLGILMLLVFALSVGAA